MRLFSLYGCVKGCTRTPAQPHAERIETEVPTFRKGFHLAFYDGETVFHACPYLNQSAALAFGKDFPVLFGQFLSGGIIFLLAVVYHLYLDRNRPLFFALRASSTDSTDMPSFEYLNIGCLVYCYTSILYIRFAYKNRDYRKNSKSKAKSFS